MNAWIGSLFARQNIDRTVAALVASQGERHGAGTRDAVKKRLGDADARLRRFQEAIAAGIDPVALVDVINEAQAQRASARAELDGTPAPDAITDAEVHAMIDALGEVGRALNEGKPESLERLYREVRLEMVYYPQERAVDVRLAPRVVSACVRGGT